MQILIVTPGARGTPLGNEVTAQRWGKLLRKLGHRVTISKWFHSKQHARVNCLIALHASRSAQSISHFSSCHPNRPIIVGLTGTDLSRDLKAPSTSAYRRVHQSLHNADRIVILEPNAQQQLPRSARHKAHIIFQSAKPFSPKPKPLIRCFEVIVAGHLRIEKDPLLAAKASQALPHDSRIKIHHIGFALTPAFARKAEAKSKNHLRYQWLGGLPHWQCRKRIARSRLLLLTSKSEGGPSVFSEAIMNDVPILSTRIPATSGMLEPDYPGLFPVGDATRLAELLHQCETDPVFFDKLVTHTRALKKRFSPTAELRAWKQLLSDL